MSPSDTTDPFAKGMVAWSQEDEKVLENYRLWQVGLISPYLGSRTIEVGAGNGIFAQAVLDGRSFERYIALEPSDHFFEGLKDIARETSGGVEVQQATIDEVVRDGSLLGTFDSVFSVHVLEHIEDDLNFVRKAFQLIRPGGHFVALVPALDFLYSPLDKTIGHFRRYEKAKMSRLAESAGVEVVMNRYDNLIGILGWLWVCKIRKVDYQSNENKRKLKGYFSFFSNYILPFASRIEKVVPPPIGLNLSCVLRKPA